MGEEREGGGSGGSTRKGVGAEVGVRMDGTKNLEL